MEKTDIDISTLVDISLAGTHSALATSLREIPFEWEPDGVRAKGTFCYIALRDGQITQEEFTNFIYHKTVPFCLDRNYLKECRLKFSATGDERWFFEPADKAKELFIKSKKKNANSGEPGEVVLFSLLEGLLNAPRIVSKMQLKTNQNMEVFGSDAIHMRYLAEEQCLEIYWGEAKLYGDLPSALEKIASSVKGFREYNPDFGKSQRDFDIGVLKRHADIDNTNASAQEALISFLDPYEDNYYKLREIHACLAIWDWDFCKTISSVDPSEAEELFKSRYKEQIKEACSLFIEKIKKHNLNTFRFHFFLIPLLDIKQFRRSFCQKMGLPFTDSSKES